MGSLNVLVIRAILIIMTIIIIKVEHFATEKKGKNEESEIPHRTGRTVKKKKKRKKKKSKYY